jgi:hypothetical protein
MTREITAEQFAAARANLVASENFTKEVPISSIKMTDTSILKGEIEINGNKVKVSNGFFIRLAGLLKLNAGLTREFIKNSDGKLAAGLMNGLTQYRRSHGTDTVLLIGNAASRQLIDICEPKRYRRLTNDGVFGITETLMNEHSNLVIETIDIDPTTGGAQINLLNLDEIGFASAGKDEFFKFGFSIVQTAKDTLVESYNQRLVCSNGLRVSFGSGTIGGSRDIRFEDHFRLTGTGADDVRLFLNRIDEMKKANFVPAQFEASIRRAQSTKASLLELETGMIAAQRKVTDTDPELKKGFVDAVGRNYFGDYRETVDRIVGKGVDPYRLNERQKAVIKTGASVWEVINSMTYLGSNNSGIEFENKAELKSIAGTLFAKGSKGGFDLEMAKYAAL